MIISVQRGMSALKERLSQRGYTVVYSDEYKRPVDAFIYSGHGGFDSFLRPPEIGAGALMSIDSVMHYGGHSGGIVEINAAGRSFDEIEELLIRSRHNIFF